MNITTSVDVFDFDPKNIGGGLSIRVTRFVQVGEGYDNLHITDSHDFRMTLEEAQRFIVKLEKAVSKNL